MINTYHSSFNPPPVLPPVPPPVPPRLSPRASYRGESVLGTNTPLVKFLSWMVLLLMLITVGGFFYLFANLNKSPQKIADYSKMSPEKLSQSRVDVWPKTESSKTPLARMIPLSSAEDGKTLLWNEQHSLIHNISFSSKSGELTIDKPGYYFIHSQVTFSKSNSKEPLRQIVWTRKSKNENQKEKEQEELMASYCNLSQSQSALCTASQAGVFRLEQGQKISVSVTDIKLVNLGKTIFGLFKLQD